MPDVKKYGLNLELEKLHQSEEDWIFGAASQPGLADIPESDRIQYLPIGELQNIGEEKFDCATRGPTNDLEAQFTYLYQNKKLIPANQRWLESNGYIKNNRVVFSDRYNSLLSGTTEAGNSLIAPIDSIHRNGMIPKSLYPQVSSFNEYYNPASLTQTMRDLGKEFLNRFKINYERVYAIHFSELYKEEMIVEAGFAWPQPVNGIYPNPGNFDPNHCFLGIANPPHLIFDNYIDSVDGDFIKQLASDYPLVSYGYRVYISSEIVPLDATALSVWEVLVKYGLTQFWAEFYKRYIATQ